MNIYIYILVIAAIMIIAYITICLGMRCCPKKIKEMLVISVILVALRVVAIAVLIIVKTPNYTSFVRNLVFLNIVYIPIVMFICLYIFYRNIDVNIKWFYGILISGIIVYLVSIFKIPMEYYVSEIYGYNIILKSSIPYKILLCVNGFGFFMSIVGFRYRYSVKWGTILIGFSSLVFIGAMAKALSGMESIGYLLLGDLAWMIALCGGMVTFKEKH
ncbi:MAG: hypothetical protein RR636_09865 [Clostridium sp.]|uniref:hypothetical protein n=1 Tax=Clostridium sp. TaxID=1506 RepID=UPI00306C937B